MSLLTRLFRRPAATLIITVARPQPWTASHRHDLATFLESETGQRLCAHARWLHIQAASLAVQTPQDAAAQATAYGSAETLRFLHAYSGLTDLPDLSPDPSTRSDDEESEHTPSLHTLLTHAPDDDRS